MKRSRGFLLWVLIVLWVSVFFAPPCLWAAERTIKVNIPGCTV